jgi:hypothetical protein
VTTLLRSVGGFIDQNLHVHDVVPLPGLGERLRAARERFATSLATMSEDDQLALANAIENDLLPDEQSTAPQSEPGEDQ